MTPLPQPTSQFSSIEIDCLATASQTFNGRVAEWYAVFTLTRHEKRVASQCQERQIESFLPLYSVKHRWRNRSTVTLELPLFPGYCFVRINPRERVQVLTVAGVVSIISSGRELLPVPNHYIASLRAALLEHRITPHPNVEVGDRVRITSGAMTGMEGILERQKNDLRVILKMEMIGRSVSVEVASTEIEPVGTAFEHSRLMRQTALSTGAAITAGSGFDIVNCIQG